MDPARQSPSGPDRNLGPTVIALNCVLFTGSCLIVIFRTGTRIWLTHNFGWDDAVMILAQVTTGHENILGDIRRELTLAR